MSFRIYFINFDYFAADTFDSIEEAVRFAKGKSFEAVIYNGDRPVYKVGPFSEGAL